ncbi:alpha/beta fold hydrolase [Actinomycetospora termitidis]|uniref:Alpha/beta hydrolase n=1 Tax=Actinomycetospora termitidis TaxID=3053470 RepID=A0ABT7MF00_9PSEU|nr:alpha/beta hydrolase [Actinomycetospora sp. Odt1-22]MDL5158759.1 alpha/beta hydrolase [Actinomycetospora sp. Odt1-22]
MPSIAIADSEYRYDDDGPRDAPAIIFIHGWTADRHRWDVPYSKLQQDYRVIRFDLRGHGANVGVPGPYQIERFAADSVFLMQELGVRKAVLVGHSMGGMTALTIALDFPELVDGLVIIGSVGKMLFSLRRRVLAIVALMLPHSVFLRINVYRAFQRDTPRTEVARYARIALWLPATMVRSAYRSMLKFDVLERLGEIICPVLIVHGRNDIQFPVGQAVELAARIPSSLLKIVFSGHEVPIEQPLEMTRAIEEYLPRLQSKKSHPGDTTQSHARSAQLTALPE